MELTIVSIFGILISANKVFTQPILPITDYETKIPNDNILHKIFTSLATCCHFNVILYPGYPVTEFSKNFLTKMGYIQSIGQVACKAVRDRTPKRFLRGFVVNDFPKFQAFPAHIFIASTSPSYQVDPSDLTSLVKFKEDWTRLNVNPTNDFFFIFVEQRTNIFLEEARFNFTHLADTLFHSWFPVNTIVVGMSQVSQPPVFIRIFAVREESFKILYNAPLFIPGPVLSLTAPFEWSAWLGTALAIGTITVALVVPNKINTIIQVFLEYYQGGLKSFATVPLVQKGTKTFEDLVEENRSINTLLQWKKDANWSFVNFISDLTFHSYKQNYKWLVEHLEVTDKPDWPFVVGLNGSVTLYQTKLLEYLIDHGRNNNTLLKYFRREFNILEGVYFSMPYGWTLYIMSYDVVGETIWRLINTGVFAFWYKMYDEIRRQNYRVEMEKALKQSMTVWNLTVEHEPTLGANIGLRDSCTVATIYCYLGGVSLATLIFSVFEVGCHYTWGFIRDIQQGLRDFDLIV
ncbi:unnamed protein product [Allacma fusca]|uniref:Uncharacterized protein n=1 Tax=Allacma fusca TaxID=39272 RepID=A0A8J2JBC2_9HEXA|nr:unnamed protein product [Allacma fusca]